MLSAVNIRPRMPNSVSRDRSTVTVHPASSVPPVPTICARTRPETPPTIGNSQLLSLTASRTRRPNQRNTGQSGTSKPAGPELKRSA